MTTVFVSGGGYFSERMAEMVARTGGEAVAIDARLAEHDIMWLVDCARHWPRHGVGSRSQAGYRSMGRWTS